jgi:hypothetical protein
MGLQVIKDGYGNDTGVFVPMKDWDTITQKHEDLKAMLHVVPASKRKLSSLAGTLSKETGKAMVAYTEQSRNEWDKRLDTNI